MMDYKDLAKRMILMHKKDKKGAVLDMVDSASGIIIAILFLILVMVVYIVASNALLSSGILTSNTQSYNDTNDIIKNGTNFGKNFAAQLPTIGTILGVVALIGGILLLVFYFRGKNQGGNVGLG